MGKLVDTASYKSKTEVKKNLKVVSISVVKKKSATSKAKKNKRTSIDNNIKVARSLERKLPRWWRRLRRPNLKLPSPVGRSSILYDGGRCNVSVVIVKSVPLNVSTAPVYSAKFF